MKHSILAALALVLLSPFPAWAEAEKPAEQPAHARPTKPQAAKAAASADAKAQPAKTAASPAKQAQTAAKPASPPAPSAPLPVDAGKKASAEPPPPAQPVPPTRAEAIKRAEAFLNSSPVLIADFVQIGVDARRSEGKLYVQKAGRLRFEYALPATMEVVADGVNVAVRDRKLNTQDTYFIEQTPLKFLLKEKIDLEKDLTIKDVVSDESGTTISIEDKSTLGGTSHLKLLFDSKTFALKQWQITDPQGYETLVSLFNIERSRAPDPKLFRIQQKGFLDWN